jgi:Pyruvate/2-oxoglutarate dehydrogenase complex, dihydrolipoamide acyltransferase (E2) component, and related enzymes
MIALSPTMNEGVIAKWNVAEGAAFSAGSVLCEVETDKASMDYEAPKDAVLLKILLPQGGKASVGEPIAIIGAAGEDPGTLAPSPSREDPVAASLSSPEPPASGSRPNAGFAAASPPVEPRAGALGDADALPGGGPSALAAYPPSSPLARSLARELGIDLRAVRGSGPGGRVIERDVRAAAEAQSATGPLTMPPSSPISMGALAGPAASLIQGPADRRIPLSTMRAAIARRLSESFYSAPHFYLKRRVGAAALLALREASGAGREKPVSLNAILLKLSAEALIRHPRVNSSWEGDSILERSSADIGLAVALPDGLVVPVVRDCGRKGILAIDDELGELIAKAKGRGLEPSDYEGASFTISNLGGFGVEEFSAIINPPGSAILSVGSIAEEPIVGPGGAFASRKALSLVLGCDHRVIDGAEGARFVAELASLIEEPGRALL